MELISGRWLVALAGACSSFLAARAQTPPDVSDIVARSVANSDADWKAAPEYSFTERDAITKGGDRTEKTYRVTMIEGSPYYETVSIDGKALSPAQKKREEKRLARVTQARLHESPAARARRIAGYEKGRRQDHLLMREMIAGFEFQSAGTEIANGRECYKIAASPRPGYVPKDNEAKVLKGMRGTLWIDTKAYQWVRVEASVFRPVAFGLFIAHVRPGTEFVLEQAPVDGNIWLPSYFEMRVNAAIAFWPHRSLDQETYSGYRKISGQTR